MSAKKSRCARCGKRFRKGGPAFRLKAELVSHFDGYIHDSDESLSELVEKIEAAHLTEEQLERQVYQKFEYLVCPTCRDEIEHFLALSNRSVGEERQ